MNGDAHIYVDGAHAAYLYAKRHSGLHATMAREVIINTSKKVGVVANKSTETEVESNVESFLKCIWFRCFHIAKGYNTKEDMLLQDNKSCIFLYKNYLFSI